jgi:hypothetical protein
MGGALVVLAGCASHPKPDPILTGATAEIPVDSGRTCMKDAPQEPEQYADAGLTLEPGKGPTRYQRIAVANDQREAFLAKLRPFLKSCR